MSGHVASVWLARAEGNLKKPPRAARRTEFLNNAVYPWTETGASWAISDNITLLIEGQASACQRRTENAHAGISDGLNYARHVSVFRRSPYPTV